MQLFLNNGKLKLKFYYDPVLIRRVKTIHGAHWNPKERVWEFPNSLLVYQQIIKNFPVSLPRFENGNGSMILKNREFKLKPYDHQVEAMKFILERFGIQCD